MQNLKRFRVEFYDDEQSRWWINAGNLFEHEARRYAKALANDHPSLTVRATDGTIAVFFRDTGPSEDREQKHQLS